VSRPLHVALAALVLVVGLVAPAAAQVDPQHFGTYSRGQIDIGLYGSVGQYTVVDPQNLPPGVALRGDIAPWYCCGFQSGLIGNATTAGTYNFTLTRNGNPEPHTIVVTDLDLKDLFRTPPGFVNKPFSYQMTALNAAGPVTFTADSGVPPGLSLSATGLIAGTPTTAGFYSINFHFSDGVHTVYRNVSVSVLAVELSTNGQLPNATQNQPYNATLAANGGTPPYLFSSPGLPSGLVLSDDGTISGTANFVGNASFNVSVVDSLGILHDKRMAITSVGVPPTLPRINPYDSTLTNCSIGNPCDMGVSVFSGGVAPFTWSASGLPPGLSLRFGDGLTSTYVAPGDAEIWGTAQAVGTFMVSLTVTDANGKTASNTFPLVVSELYQEQFLPGASYGVPFSSTIRMLGGRQPYSGTIINNDRLPLGLTLNPTTLTVSGTPLEHGSFNFRLLVTDADGRTWQRRQFFFVGGVGTTLQINTGDDLGFALEGANYSRTLSACCAPSYNWTIQGGTLPAGLSLSPTGLLSGLIAVGASTAVPGGVYEFLVEVEDGTNPANFALRQMRLTVTTTSVTTSSTLPFGNVGTFYTTTLTSSPSGATWSVEPFQYLPAGLSLSPAGVLSGTPMVRGQFNFGIRATVGGQSTVRFFTLIIYGAGENPPVDVSFGPNLTALMGQWTFTMTPFGGVAPYTASYAPGAPLVPGFRFQSGTPMPTFMSGSAPNLHALLGVGTVPGVYSTTLRVTDSVGQSIDRPVNVRVSPLTIQSPTTLPRATVGQPYSFTLTGVGAPAYGWSATNLPAGLSIDGTGQISGTPTLAGTYNPTITISDLSDPSLSIGTGFTINVHGFPITTGAVLPNGTQNVAYNQALSAPACIPCTWSITSGGLPAGLSLNSATGVIAGTPTGTSTGTSFTVQASTGALFAQKQMGIRINPVSPAALSISTTGFNDSTFGGFTTQQINVAGGIGPYTWSLESGTLPNGISLHQSGELIGATTSPVHGHLAGRPLALGLFNFTLRVTDSLGATTTRAFAWRITALSFHYTSLPVGPASTTGQTGSLTLNQPYSQQLLVAGGSGSYTFSGGTLPPGLVLSPTGLISGSATNTGSFSTLVTANDGAGTVHQQNINFTVSSGTPVTVTIGLGPALGTAQLGASQTFNVNPSGGTAPYTLTALTPLPTGYAFQGTQIIGHAVTPGNHTFTVQVTDNVGNIGVRTFTLTVAGIAITPGFTTLQDGSVGEPYSQTISTVGLPGTTFAVTGGSLPGGLTLAANGTISGTPAGAGTFQFTVTATNGVAITQNYSLRISSMVFQDPIVLPAAMFGEEYEFTFTVTGGGTGKNFQLQGVAGLPPGLGMSSSGTLAGVSQQVNSGIFGLIITVTDTSGTISRRFVLPVTSPNPSLLDIAQNTTVLLDAVAGQSFSNVLSVSGGVPPYTWSVAGGSSLPPGLALLPASPTATTPGGTQIVGVPQTAGTYVFDLIATDNTGDTVRRTYTMKVSSIGFVPTAGTTMPVNVAMTPLQLHGFGGTAPYTFSIAPVNTTQPVLPPGVSMTPQGLVSGTPTGTGSFQGAITITDALGVTFTRRLTFFVVQAGSNLFVSSGNLVLLTGRPVNQNLTLGISGAGSLPNTMNWSVVGGALPPGTFLSDDDDLVGFNQTALIGQPTTPGTYVYTVRGTNAANGAQVAERQVTAIVNGMVLTNLVVFGNALAEVGTPFSQQLRVAGGVAPYTFTTIPASPLPAGLTLSSTGLISGTPQTTGNLVAAFSYTDSVGATQTGTFAMLITNPGEAAPLQALSTSPTFNMQVVGYPFATFISQWVRGGKAPYTVEVAPGHSLPPGTAIYSGGNGWTFYLGGIPTTEGEYEFDLIYSDSTGQSVTLTFEGEIWPGGFTVSTLPTGRVGTPYLASLAPIGGVPPYTVLVDPTGGLPAGLTMSTAGVLSGTPTSVGNHTVNAYVIDSEGNEAMQFYRVAIDNPAGEAPSMSLSPNPIDIYYQLGTPAPVVPVAVQVTSGSAPFTLHLADMPSVTLSAPGGTAPASVNLIVNPAVGVGTYFGVLSATSQNAVSNFPDAVPVRLTVVPAPPCTYAVNPTGTSMAAAGGGGAFDVAAGAGCAWTAVASEPWITVTSGASGTAAGAVNFSVAANGAASTRNGTITVNGAEFAISQFGSACSFAINPVSIGAPASGGVAAVTVTASSACGPGDTWTAVGLGATPAVGSGDGTVTLTIPPNGNAASQVLNATIAGVLFTVNQAGASCTVALSATGSSFTNAGGPGAVNVSTPAGCPYTTVAGPSWVGVNSGGSGIGGGTLVYSVEPNPTTVPRAGALTIGGEIFTITQEALACSATLDTSTLGSPMAAGGGVGSVGVTMNGANCAWTASSDAAWATVAPGGGTGVGSVLVTASSNAASTSARSATLTIAGQAVLLNQAGTQCTFSLLSAAGSVPAAGGAGSVGVVAPAACGWGSSSNDGWLSISSSGSGGTGNVNFVAQPNPTSEARSGSLTIAGVDFVVNQAAAPCAYTLTPNTIAVSADGASDSFAVTTGTGGCAPEAVSYASWAHVSTLFGGMAGTVSYTVDPNPSALTRIGIVQVGNQNFTITQLGAACAYSLNAYGAYFGSSGGNSSFIGSPSGIGCTPVVGVDLPSIVTLGPLGGPVSNIFTQPYEVSPFVGQLTPVIRRARISFGGTIFLVKQSSW
jgi:hypothetical protein